MHPSCKVCHTHHAYWQHWFPPVYTSFNYMTLAEGCKVSRKQKLEDSLSDILLNCSGWNLIWSWSHLNWTSQCGMEATCCFTCCSKKCFSVFPLDWPEDDLREILPSYTCWNDLHGQTRPQGHEETFVSVFSQSSVLSLKDFGLRLADELYSKLN